MDLSYVFEQGDPVLIAVFCLLILMSLTTWYLIFHRGYCMWRYHRASRRFSETFWHSKDWSEAYQLSARVNVPQAEVARAGIDSWRHYRSQAHTPLGETCGLDDFLVRAIRNAMSQAGARLESGLTLLASVGSTAPFVGLFGTVWGIYHALTSIATSGNASLDTVAGPMGEALIATAAGLAAALPAVLAYNALTRGNRILKAEMDGFAYDLHAQLLAAPRGDDNSAPEPQWLQRQARA